MKSDWYLKQSANINQMLRIKQNIACNKEEYPFLLMVKHRYHVADDIMFPDPACLAFFTAFEEHHLGKLQNSDSLQLVGVDIFEGLMQFYIYCKDAQKSMYDCIEFLKSNSYFQVEFEIIQDKTWSGYEKLIG